MTDFNVRGLGFTLFLGGLSALPPLAIDMALPGVPSIQAEFAASPAEAAAVIAIFIAGFSTAPLAVGPLADRYGRKPAMLAGLGLFTLCGLGCALALSIGALLAFRLLQGVGAGAVGVLPRAVIRDLFEGRAGRLQLAAVSVVFSVAPLIAPTLGAGILTLGDWRAIFLALVAVGAAMTLIASFGFRESHPCDKRRSLKPAIIIAGYRRALTHPMCAGFSVIGGTTFAGLFAYVNTSPLLFMQGFGVSKAGFAGLFAITASGVIVGSTINTWLLNRHARPRTVLDVALCLICCVAIGLVAVSFDGTRSPFAVAALVMIYISTFGLVFPNVVHEAIHPLPEIAGVASAVVQSIQMLFGAVGGVAAAAFYRHGSPLSIGLVMSVGAICALALYFGWLRPQIED
ncbi:MAG TPA: multidrug effflux MFS transporter [Roseiarcus sp.]|jgi:DHA1 family bicyclomycin/chloramphenicol resistance-like MFS transporter|nr:multidrug effflux MFS transporter [Roseiarcus sp.]